MINRLRQYLVAVITDQVKRPGDEVVKFVLLLASFFYQLIARIISGCYRLQLLRPHRINRCLISVGNLTWGGTGKTPLVRMLAEELTRRGRKVSVLSRGYGGDEDVFLREVLDPIPVLVGRKRIEKAGEAIRNYGAEVIILDDGFQQWRLARDLDLVTINSRNPFGNGRLLPRGILREPLAALKRADVFFLTRADGEKKKLSFLRQKLRALNPEALIVEAVYTPGAIYNLGNRNQTVQPETLTGERIALLAGIADPESFRLLAEGMGLEPEVEFFFPDHHQYSLQDLLKVTAFCSRRGVRTVITTEKDGAKLKRLCRIVEGRPNLACRQQARILVLAIEIKIIRNEEEFINRLSGVVGG